MITIRDSVTKLHMLHTLAEAEEMWGLTQQVTWPQTACAASGCPGTGR